MIQNRKTREHPINKLDKVFLIKSVTKDDKTNLL